MKKVMQMQMALALAGVLTLGLASTGQATVYVWDGGGADNNFWTANNWVGNAVNTHNTHQFVFSDASLRGTVVTHTTQNRDTGPFTFGADAFTISQSGGSLRLNQTATYAYAIEYNTTNTITFNGHVTAYQGSGQMIIGTGTGRLLFNAGFNVNNGGNGTFAGAGTYVLNNLAGTSSGANRTVTIGGTCTVLANNTSGSGSGLGAVVVNSGASLGGNGIFTPGDATNVRNVTTSDGGRLSPGDSLTPATAVGTMTFAFANAAGRLVLDTGALFTFDLAAPDASDKIAVTAGGVTLNGQQFGDFTFNTLPGFTAGTYTLIESVATTGSLGDTTTGTVGDRPAELRLVGHNVVLDIKPAGTLLTIR